MADMKHYLKEVLNKGQFTHRGGVTASQPKTAAIHHNQPQNNPDCVKKSTKSGMVTGFTVHKHGLVRTISVRVIDGIINALKH